jgi:GMP synthase-like glutamine amidotransferase
MTRAGRPDGQVSALIIQNCEVEGLGLYETELRRSGAAVSALHAHRGQAFPGVGEHDLVVVGGTPVSVNDVGAHEFLVRERAFLERAVAGGRTVLGICFGAQLLASVLGARVGRCPSIEVGGSEVELTADGRASPLLAGFPARFPVFQWHADAFGVPEGARLLARGDRCPNQAFAEGRAIGLQFHLEVAAADVARWSDAYAGELAVAGRTKAQVVRGCREREARMAELAGLLVSNLLEEAHGARR